MRRARDRRGTPRDRARTAASLVALVWLTGCASDPPRPDDSWQVREARHRETMAELYPVGTPRSEIRARADQHLVFSIYACDYTEAQDDPFLDMSLEEFQKRFPGVPPACDRLRLGKTGWYTIFGGVRLFQDYVFYDEDDRVLVAYRTFLHKSSAR